jgi:CheY-like chemotaxis protein
MPPAGNQPDTQLLLRADLSCNGRTVAAHTTEVTVAGAFIVMADPFPVDSVVHARLSFPNLVEPFEVIACVKETAHSTQPGEPTGIRVQFVFRSRKESEHIAELLSARPMSTERKTPYRVLLVEDNTLIRDMFAYGVKKFFSQRSPTVVVDQADSSEHAWKMLGDGTYDLAIIDFYLPGSNGASLVAKMRANERLARIPVVAISTGGDAVRTATLDAGADFFLAKPIVAKVLFSTLERLTARGGDHP